MWRSRTTLVHAIQGLVLAGMLVLASGCGGVSQAPVQATSSSPASSTAAQPSSAPATQVKQTSPLEKLPKTYKDSDELYAALAKLTPAEQQQAIVEGAKKEGKVLMYAAGDGPHIPGWKKGFETRYPGMTMEWLVIKEEDLVAKMHTEAQAGQYLWDFATGIGLSSLRNGGLLAKNYGIGLEKWPKAFYGEDWVGYQGLVTVITYNTDQVKPDQAPKTYMELLEPKWKGKAHIDTGPDTLLNAMLLKWGEQKTTDWLRRFVVDNQAVIRKGHTAATGLLAAGEFPVASELYGYTVERMRVEDKAPIDWLVPELFAMELSGPVLAKKSTRPFAALLGMQYVISKEAQAHFATFGRMVAHPEVEFAYPRLKALMTDSRQVVVSADSTEKVQPIVDKLVKELIQPRVKGKS